MAAKQKNVNASKGRRYTATEKAEILAFVEAQGRGGQSAASKKFKISPLTISSWRRQAGGTDTGNSGTKGVEKDAVLKVLSGKGFKIIRLQNMLTGEVMEEKIDPKIEKLGLEFGLKGRASDSSTYVSQSSPQILVTMTLDRLLALTGTKP